ncbi:KpsF/GutQ family sugar-phosphate isomerase [Idiomarina sp. 29L]|uniref:KpsF/GutQ family sugar-phosphate isomerase n=1 Tax=Idiomarina sp. 29L TaxID=2508877 RepID=UPI00101032E1|nr:KpsF/GutQ family sugar-phosphate isomerase [Idiomarina sp. 29L]RXS43548.1 KpsF/GutQ family sugar-phosphate isomerase [Idiomarina sp. 29L]
MFSYKGIAQRVFETQCSSINFVAKKIDSAFDSAVTKILDVDGRVIVCGMGKSGHVGKKIFATLVSTGTPSFFLHPSEAFHGDLGMVQPSDVFLAISNSGETEELLRLIPFLKDNGNTLICMTGNPSSTLAQNADCHLDIGVQEEACPLQLAPTSSTTATLVMGDALAIALMEARQFKPENFARFHPGGSLGRKLLSRVIDFALPAVTVHADSDFKFLLTRIANSKCGVVCVTKNEKLVGVITDGDIRRALSSYELSELNSLSAESIMTKSPKVVSYSTKCVDADTLMSETSVNSLIVNDEANNLYIYQNLNRGAL